MFMLFSPFEFAEVQHRANSVPQLGDRATSYLAFASLIDLNYVNRNRWLELLGPDHAGLMDIAVFARLVIRIVRLRPCRIGPVS